MSKVIWY